jgi:hypothetical protein
MGAKKRLGSQCPDCGWTLGAGRGCSHCGWIRSTPAKRQATASESAARVTKQEVVQQAGRVCPGCEKLRSLSAYGPRSKYCASCRAKRARAWQKKTDKDPRRWEVSGGAPGLGKRR